MAGLPTVLLLGGTTEAAAIADAVGARLGGRVDLIVSFAGRTTSPTTPFGRQRVGGFGGTDGLAHYLGQHEVSAVLDALHPFAAVMAFHASEACRTTGIPLVKVVRAGWTEQAGDRWARVATMADVPEALERLGATRVLLTIGRQELEPFRTMTGVHVIVRSIEPPDLSGGWDAVPLLDRGPFTVEGETRLLADEGIDALVTKDSGGAATAAKLTAARQLGIAVVIVDRPRTPTGAEVASVDAAMAWLEATLDAADQPAG